MLYDAIAPAAEANGNEILYGPGGGKLAVMNGQNLVRADVPPPGGAEAVYESGGLTAYRHADQLGSAPLASTPNNTVWSAVGYAPYGEPFSSTGSDRSFTGQKQDVVAGQYDFLLRDYSPTLSRWWTPDPAGLAAVDPNNPQTWNRYGYVNGRPLGLIDRFGMQPCHSAALHRDRGTDADGDFGPYDSGDPDSSAQQDDCDPPPNCAGHWTLDGGDIPCNLAGPLELGGSGGGDALDPNQSSICQTALCGVTIINNEGGPEQWGLKRIAEDDPCTPSPGASFCSTVHEVYKRTDLGPAGGCRWDLACHAFVGFGNLFLNERPSGALELAGALTAGVVAYAPATALEGVAAAGSAVGTAVANTSGIGNFVYSYALSNPAFLVDFTSALTPWPSFALSAGGVSGALVSNWTRITTWIDGH